MLTYLYNEDCEHNELSIFIRSCLFALKFDDVYWLRGTKVRSRSNLSSFILYIEKCTDFMGTDQSINLHGQQW